MKIFRKIKDKINNIEEYWLLRKIIFNLKYGNPILDYWSMHKDDWEYRYQKWTPWFRPRYRLLHIFSNYNYGKYLLSGFTWRVIRERDIERPKVLKLSVSWGRAKIYTLNHDYSHRRKVYSHWCLTTKQCLKVLDYMMKKYPNLNWFLCPHSKEVWMAQWVSSASQYLITKKAYWVIKKKDKPYAKDGRTLMTEQQIKDYNQQEFQMQFFLMMRDCINKEKYAMKIQNMMQLSLDLKNKRRYKRLLADLIKLIGEINCDQVSFWKKV